MPDGTVEIMYEGQKFEFGKEYYQASACQKPQKVDISTVVITDMSRTSVRLELRLEGSDHWAHSHQPIEYLSGLKETPSAALLDLASRLQRLKDKALEMEIKRRGKGQ